MLILPLSFSPSVLCFSDTVNPVLSSPYVVEHVRYLKLVSGHNGELSHRTLRICQLCQSLFLSNLLKINKPRSGLINYLLQERQINDLTTSQVTKARKNCVCRLDALFCLIFSPVLGLLVRRLFRRYPYHRN